MIAEFMAQEIASHERYGEFTRAALEAEGVDESLFFEPDLASERDNAARRRVLGRYRGYGTGLPNYLTGFPSEGVAWNWYGLRPAELLDCLYIRYSYWTEISAGTRSPRIAADRIRDGQTAFGVPNDNFERLAARFRLGFRVPPLILVSADGGETLVVMEGHARITAYALAPEAIPDPIEVLIGMSPDIARWDEY
jgi:hypothetical protein